MNRKTAREIAMHIIFASGFQTVEVLADCLDAERFKAISDDCPAYASPPDDSQREYISRLVSGVLDHALELDSYIEKYSIGWKYGRISRVASSIMRLCMFEVLYMPDIPDSASINEAVDLAKKYETEDAAAFINGILGSFIRKEADLL